jgi:hypothetical protein
MGWLRNLITGKSAGNGADVWAELMLTVAEAHGYVGSSGLQVVPELLGNENKIIAWMNHLVQERIDTTGTLQFQEIHSTFLFAVCRGYEAAYHWKKGDTYDIKPDGLFDGRVSCQISFALSEALTQKPLADDLFYAFQDWCANHPNYCARRSLPLLLPLQTCWQYAYRIATHQALACMEA